MKKYVEKSISLLMIFIINAFVIRLLSEDVLASTTSIGISLSNIKNELLLRGSHYEKEIVISRAKPEEAALAIVEVEAPDIEEWITFIPGQEVVLPRGEQRVSLKMIIDVPLDAQLRNYSGFVRIKVVSERSDEQIMSIPAVRMNIDLTVNGEEKSDLVVRMVSIDDFIKGQPLVLMMKIGNDGNVSDAPVKVKLHILDLNNNLIQLLEKEPIEPVSPFTTREVLVTFNNIDLNEGGYFADIIVYDKDNIFKDNIAFKVVSDVKNLNVFKEAVKEEGDVLGVKDEKMGNSLVKIGGVVLLTQLFILMFYLIWKRLRNYKRNEVLSY